VQQDPASLVRHTKITRGRQRVPQIDHGCLRRARALYRQRIA
jgi:hypothetical protein